MLPLVTKNLPGPSWTRPLSTALTLGWLLLAWGLPAQGADFTKGRSGEQLSRRQIRKQVTLVVTQLLSVGGKPSLVSVGGKPLLVSVGAKPLEQVLAREASRAQKTLQKKLAKGEWANSYTLVKDAATLQTMTLALRAYKRAAIAEVTGRYMEALEKHQASKKDRRGLVSPDLHKFASGYIKPLQWSDLFTTVHFNLLPEVPVPGSAEKERQRLFDIKTEVFNKIAAEETRLDTRLLSSSTKRALDMVDLGVLPGDVLHDLHFIIEPTAEGVNVQAAWNRTRGKEKGEPGGESAVVPGSF